MQAVAEQLPKSGDVLSQGEGTVGTLNIEQHPEPVVIYSLNRKDNNYGLPSLCLMTNLEIKMAERLPEGGPAWSLVDPGVRPSSGNLKCFLHPEHPEADKYRNFGFSACMKANIKNISELELHMQRKHKQEWKTIERAREIADKKSMEELQRAILMGLARNAGLNEIAVPAVDDTPKISNESVLKIISETVTKPEPKPKKTRRPRRKK